MTEGPELQRWATPAANRPTDKNPPALELAREYHGGKRNDVVLELSRRGAWALLGCCRYAVMANLLSRPHLAQGGPIQSNSARS